MSEAPDVLVLGGSISALMTAAWLKLDQPELDVMVLGPPPEREQRPYVGESLVEPAVLFLRELGMGDFLDDHCALKNGLTFYHKLRPGDPADRRYSVHAPRHLHHLARQLNRPVFDRALLEHAVRLGVRVVDGLAEDVTLGRGGERHRVRARIADRTSELSARWLIDATGRKRVVGHKVTAYTRPTERQRSTFWIRLAGFEPFLPHIEMSARRPHDYDLWFSTHHFMGPGNWTWGIPLQSGEHERLISLGVAWRPDVFPDDPIRSLEGMIALYDRTHPALADMIRSGTVLDTNRYYNYLYAAEHIYSLDGWFLVGDAARTVDPLYSTGMSMSSIQALQVSGMIRRQREGRLSAADVAALEDVWMRLGRRNQDDISDQYATMHDPLQACMRRYWNVCGWFNGVLPLWWNGFLTDPVGARLIAPLLSEPDPDSRAAWALFAESSRRVGEDPRAELFDRTADLDVVLNLRFDCSRADLAAHISRMFVERAHIRWSLARMGGWGLVSRQLPRLSVDLAKAAVVRLFLAQRGRQAFREVRAPLQRLIASREAGGRTRHAVSSDGGS
jgi:flavin-dependent dehydrogenase